MRYRPVTVLFVLLLLAGAAPLAGAQQQLKDFEEYAENARQAWDVPGMAVAVVKDDHVVLAKGFGALKLGDPRTIDEGTIFNIGSNTKAMTVAGLGILVDEKKIAWDDRVTQHLPRFQLFDAYVTREMTIRDLLSHRSGLPDYGGDLIWWGSDRTPKEILKRLTYVRPTFGFRDGFGYQNMMYVAAGEIIRRRAGKPWDAFLSDRLFKPLGMGDTNTSYAAWMATENRATPHMLVGGMVKPIGARNLDNGGPAVAINSNARDMGQWLRFQLGDGEFGGRRVLSAESLTKPRSPQNVLQIREWFQNKAGTNAWTYGMGWRVLDYCGHKLVHHGGWTDGMYSAVAMVPDRKVGVVVLTNLHNRDLSFPMALAVLDRLLVTGNAVDWPTFYLSRWTSAERRAREADETAQRDRVKGTNPSLPVARYAGTYRNDVYGELRVSEGEGKLVVDLCHSPTYVADLDHWHFDTFKAVWRDLVAEQSMIRFSLGEDGRVAQLDLKMSDFIDPTTYVFKRNTDQ